ncbi:MAG: hypothetical protein ACHQ7M_01145 [Chloroflexota bacterium]
MASEESLRERLQVAAAQAYGEQRAGELTKRLGEISRWLALIEQQPLDLLAEAPDGDGR